MKVTLNIWLNTNMNDMTSLFNSALVLVMLTTEILLIARDWSRLAEVHGCAKPRQLEASVRTVLPSLQQSKLWKYEKLFKISLCKSYTLYRSFPGTVISLWRNFYYIQWEALASRWSPLKDLYCPWVILKQTTCQKTTGTSNNCVKWFSLHVSGTEEEKQD